MGTKLKSNKYVLGGIVVLLVYLLSFSLFLISDLYKERNFSKSDPYFSSDRFTHELDVFSKNLMSFYVDYRDFDKKSDNEKVTDREVSDTLSLNERYILDQQQETTNNYYNLIVEANNKGDYDTAKNLNDDLTKKREEIRNKNVKTSDEIRNEMINWKTNDYENIKNALMKNTYIKYYIKNIKTNEVYSNMNPFLSNDEVENYIKENALYSMHFPNDLSGTNFKYLTNSFFNNSYLNSYIIIPKDIDKNSYIYKNYEYYNSVRSRLLKEQIMLFLAISIIVVLFIYFFYSKKSLWHMNLVKKIFLFTGKMSLLLKSIITLILFLVVFFYLENLYFFYTPLGIVHFLRLTLFSIIIGVLSVTSIDIIVIVENKDNLKEEIKGTIVNYIFVTIKYLLQYKKSILKLVSILGTCIVICIYMSMNQFSGGSIAIVCIIYIVIIFIYVLRIFVNFCKIAHGTDKITSGNLNYEIDISGKSTMAKLAANINNMKLGFKKALEEQVKSERLKSELITNVSHDLKTPLTSIINYVDLLKAEDVTEQERINYIGILDKKSQRLKVLIEDLFEASKLSSGNIEMNIEKIDVTSLLKQALGELNHKIEESNLIFKINIPKEKIYSNLDGKRTWRVFDNLINNALKYSQPNTRVYIYLEEADENIMFTIKNISAYELDFDEEEIFERFKRGDSSRSTEGSGLGLAIAKSIVELEQGSIDINIDGDLFKVIVKFKKIK